MGRVKHLHGRRSLVRQRGTWQVVLVQTGVGPANAKTACLQAISQASYDLIVSSGFACALRPVQIGDILIGTAVMFESDLQRLEDRSGRTACEKHVIATALREAAEAGLAAHTGDFITTPRVVWRAADKRPLAEAAGDGAIGLDMESAALAAVARAHGIPFAIIRATSDLLDEDLPLDFNLFLNPADWFRGMLVCLAKPTSLLDLWRLRRQSAIASERLATVFGRLLDGLC